VPTPTRKIIRELEREGLTVTLTAGSHIKITHPDMAGPVFTGSSPSDRFVMSKVWADIRRQKRRKKPQPD